MPKTEEEKGTDKRVNFGDLERKYGSKLFLVALATIRQGGLRQGEIRDLAEVLADNQDVAPSVGIGIRRLVDDELPGFAEKKKLVSSAKGVVQIDQKMNLIWRDPTKLRDGTNLEETILMARMERVSGDKLRIDPKDKHTLVGAHHFVTSLLNGVSPEDKQKVPWHVSSELVEGNTLIESAIQELLETDPRLLKKAAMGMRISSERVVHRLVSEHLSTVARRWNEIFGVGSREDLSVAESGLTTWVAHLSDALEKTVANEKGDFEMIRGWIEEEIGYWKKMRTLEKRADGRLAGK